MLKPVLLAFPIPVWLCASAFAQSGAYPSLSGEVSIELQDDWAYRSDERASEHNDLYTTTEPSVTIRLGPSWSVFAHAVLEPMTSPDQFESRIFGDHGIFLEDLFVEYATGPVHVRAGKMNVGFGVAWDLAPGVYGTDFAEDGYETAERIALGGGWTIDADRYGEHRISAATFFLDTTVLSESALFNRGRTRKSDGGVSNTEDFSSWIVAVDGSRIAGVEDIAYHIAYMHQAGGEGDSADEDSLALALYGTFEIGAGVRFAPLVEYVYQDSPGGAADMERDFLTVSGQLLRSGYNVAAAWTRRHTRNGAGDDDYQVQISAGYAFDWGLTFDMGWKIAEEANVKTSTLGALATYTISF